MNRISTFRCVAGTILFCILLFTGSQWAHAQMLIPNTTAQTQNFDGMGSSATATLPTGFRVSDGTMYSTGTTTTTQAAGTTGVGVLTGGSTGGTYNFANGVTASSTDRALGFLTSGSFTSPRSIMLEIQNTTGSTITELAITFDYEKYRSGTRAFDWTFFSGTDGIAWTARTAGDQSYAADANNTTISNPPTTIGKTVTITGLSIAHNAKYYLRWTFTGVGGSTNGQAIGIDNFSVTATVAAPPDYTITTTGNAIIITDISGNGETLNVTESGSNVNFNVVGRTYSLNGGAVTAFPVNVPLAGANSISINTAAGNDIINIGAFTANLPSLSINGGTGDDVVNFNGDITFAANANLDVDLQNDDATPGVDQVTVAANANLILSGTGAATVKVSRNIVVNAAGSIETVDGNLTVEANQQMTATSGSFVGVDISGGALQINGSGALTVKGRGGNTGSIQHGIQITGAGKIEGGNGTGTVVGTGGTSTGSDNYGIVIATAGQITSGGSGTVSVSGTGGSGPGLFNYGLLIEGANSRITSGGGAVEVNGQGGGGSGSGSLNHGIRLAGAAQITSGGSGTVTVQGTGGTGTGSDNYGIVIATAGQITSGGSGTVSVSGTGGSGPGFFNYGLIIEGADSRITSGGGDVEVTGQGGGGSGSGTVNHGIRLVNEGRITSGGSGTVTVQGTGGTGTGSDNYGVEVRGTNTQITSSGGAVLVTGTGGGTATPFNYGVFVVDGGVIMNAGTGAAATVTVVGQGGNSPGAVGGNYGIYLDGSNTQITSSGGAVSVTGIGNQNSEAIRIQSNAGITSGGNADITVVADGINLIAPGLINSGMGATTIRPRTTGTRINLGGADVLSGSPLTLGLTDAELDQVSAGTLILGNANSGNLTVSAAISRPAATNVQLRSGGDVIFNENFNTNGGTLLLVPGNSPAAVKPVFNGTDATASVVSFASDLDIVINGTTPGDGAGATYTQLTVLGDVNLTGVDLVLSGSHAPAFSQTFTIVDNLGANPITGIFNGLPEGAIITNFLGSGLEVQISYAGGTGNDVVLTVLNPCPAITFTATPTDACSGSNGQIAISGETGGTGPYMYSINNGMSYQSGATFTGLAVDTYQVKIKDANDCESDATSVMVAAPTCPATGTLTWTGAVNSNWNNPCNWDVFCVPAAANEVIIPNVSNDPVIMGGTVASAKSVYVQSGAALTVSAMGSLTLEGSTSSPSGGMFNQGTVTNNGAILVGPNISPGQYGIVNEAVFNNNAAAEIRIDRTFTMGFWNYAASATLTNAGALIIGETAASHSVGLRNEGNVQNTGGEIRIDRFNGSGLHNLGNSTVSNSGKIIIGKIAAPGSCIYNFGHITNLAAGEVELDRGSSGIFNTTSGGISSSFTNAGKIAIGQTANISGPGIYNLNFAATSASFENLAGGEILIDRFGTGIHNDDNCSFDNSGLIKIATTALGTGFNPGIYNRNTFNNHSGGEIRMDSLNRPGLHHQSGTLTNGGKMILGINLTVADGYPGVYNEASFVNQEDAELHIDRFPHVGFQNAFNASMTNAGLIKIGENVLGGNNGLYNDGTFENQATGEIHIDNIPDANNRNGVYNTFGRTFTNAGKIFIGSAVGAGTTGLFNSGTFSNSGEITVNNVRGTFSRQGLYHDSGIFTNTGKITLGSVDSIGHFGIFSVATFNNNAGGEISIDRCAITGVRNGNFGSGGTFTNAGKLNIGANAGVGNWGLWNERSFINSGELTIDNAAVSGLRHQSNVFTNSGSMALGQTGTVGEWGLWSRSYFVNEAAGEISIDRTGSTGLLVISDSLHNRGSITIGELAPVGPQAIYSGQTVRNFPCGVINIYAPLHNVSTFANLGLFYVNTAGMHTNTGFALNSGIITYPQGNPIPGMINQEIIIAPLTVNGCDEISPAFSLGSPVDFTIEGIFTDEAATMSAGTYVTATNTFTPIPALIEDTHQFYVKITDGSGGCTRIVAWELTTQNCCDAPEALCKPAAAVLVGNSASIVVADVDNGSTAECGLQSITVSPSTFNCSHVGTPQTVTLTVTDVNGSSSTCTATVTVIDNTPPSISCPATQTLALNADCRANLPNYTGLAAVSDSCGVQSVTQSPAAGTLVSGAGNMVVTLYATDVNNNIDSCSFTVIKVDNTPPSITCPATQTLALGANCTATLPDYTGMAAVSDSCGVQSVTQSPAAGTLVSGAGNMVVRLFATDINNNIDSCSFTVTKVDNTPPTIQCFNEAVTFNGETTIPLNAGSLVDTTDNCGVASIVLSPTAISCEQVGQTVPVAITVTDVNGNPATCTSNITVGGLPCGWSQNPNGVNCADGNNIAYNPANGVWTATSTNCFYGPGFTSDATAFAQRTLCGDGSITAQVTSINGNGWAGVVMRESNAAGAKKAQLMTNLSSLSRREFRTTTNGAANPQQFPSQDRYWLRITRAGNQFSMYVSPNGAAWYFVGAQNIPMNSCIQMGLVVTNYQQTSTVTATFANVGFSGGSAVVSAGIEQRAESIEMPHTFEAYPNPTSGELNVNLAQYLGRAVRVEVYSLTGQLLHFVEIDEVQAVVERLDLSAFTAGMYLVKVKSDGLPDVMRRVVLNR
ncbi:MAG: HYR domain-containing protein [Saprospiraceae bacterium]|nr:HYR domain-containing protein [Saprospiraceae bacterium]